MVFRPLAEPHPSQSAYSPVSVGSSALFDGYRSSAFWGCFDRMNRINGRPCEVGFSPRISRILRVFGCSVFNAKNAKVLTQRGRKDFALLALRPFANFASKTALTRNPVNPVHPVRLILFENAAQRRLRESAHTKIAGEIERRGKSLV